MSTRILSLAPAVALALSSVACMAPAGDDGKNATNEPRSLANLGQKSGPTASEGTGGTCAASCAHYLACKGASTDDNQARCVDDCKGLGLTSSQLGEFEAADCATAIATVEGAKGGTSSGGSSGSASAKGSECDGCVRDGSSCIWLSQSNWGSGPYSGAAAECSSYCCE